MNGFVGVHGSRSLVKLNRLRNGEREREGGGAIRGLVGEGARWPALGVTEQGDVRTSDKWTAVRIHGRISPDRTLTRLLPRKPIPSQPL